MWVWVWVGEWMGGWKYISVVSAPLVCEPTKPELTHMGAVIGNGKLDFGNAEEREISPDGEGVRAGVIRVGSRADGLCSHSLTCPPWGTVPPGVVFWRMKEDKAGAEEAHSKG